MQGRHVHDSEEQTGGVLRPWGRRHLVEGIECRRHAVEVGLEQRKEIDNDETVRVGRGFGARRRHDGHGSGKCDGALQGRKLQLVRVKAWCVRRSRRHRDLVRQRRSGKCSVGAVECDNNRRQAGSGSDTSDAFRSVVSGAHTLCADADRDAAAWRAGKRDRAVQRRHVQLREAAPWCLFRSQRCQGVVQVIA